MPIALQTQADGGEVNATSISWSHYVTGSNRGLVVLLAFDNTGVGNISGSYNGVWMEPVIPGGVPDGDDGTVWAFYLANPDTGNNTVFVDFNNVVINTHGYSVQLIDCDTTNLIDTTGSAFNIAAGNPTQTVVTNNNNSMLVDIYKHESNSLGSGPQETGQTQIYDHDNGTWIGGCSYRPTTTAGSYAMTWDGGLDDSWCHIVIALKESGPPPQTVATDTLQLQSSPPDLSISAGAATVSTDTLELSAYAPDLSVQVPPISISVDTLLLQSNANDIVVSPSAVSQALDTLLLNASAIDLSVSPSAVTTSLDTLLMQSFANDLAVIAGAATISTDTLFLNGTANDITVSPSAVSTLLDTLLLQSSALDLSVILGAGI
jgi:hypothetical protein